MRRDDLRSLETLRKHFAANNHNLWAITPQITDQPNILVTILQIIGKANVNVSALVSRPVKGHNNQYSFFLTLDTDYTICKPIMDEIAHENNYVQHLGWWYID
jgi:prephenate dehydratase